MKTLTRKERKEQARIKRVNLIHQWIDEIKLRVTLGTKAWDALQEQRLTVAKLIETDPTNKILYTTAWNEFATVFNKLGEELQDENKTPTS